MDPKEIEGALQIPRQKWKETGSKRAIIPGGASQLLWLLQRVALLVDQKPCSAQEVEHVGAVCLQFEQGHKWITRNGKQPDKLAVRKREIERESLALQGCPVQCIKRVGNLGSDVGRSPEVKINSGRVCRSNRSQTYRCDNSGKKG